MAERIQGTINKIETKIKNGVLKHKKVKTKRDTFDNFIDPDIKKLVKGADVINKSERKQIDKEARKSAQSPVVKVKRKISKEIGRDLGLKMS